VGREKKISATRDVSLAGTYKPNEIGLNKQKKDLKISDWR